MKGWRTIAVFVVTGLTYLLAWQPLTQLVDAQWVATGSAVLGIVMRLITSTPVANKE